MTLFYNRPEQKTFRQFLRSRPTRAEQVMWYALRGQQLGIKFRRQYGVERFVLDFYCPSLRLAIEVDGDTHVETAAAAVRDQERQRWLEQRGIQVIRFTDEEVIEDMEGVVERIQEVIRRLQEC